MSVSVLPLDADAGQVRWLAWLFHLVVVMALACLLWRLWWPYSYWLDEIYAVVAARESLPVMFFRWILVDVHPPLYQLLLNGWVALFGVTEPATRALSVLAGLLVTYVAIVMVRRQRDLLPWGILLLSLPWFAYYSQEVRPYILLYLLGVVSTLAMVQGRNRVLLVTLVLMAWVHYFGLLLGLSLLFARLVVARQLRWGDVLAGLLMLTWLPLHLAFGSGLGQAGHFWIRVSGPGETLANFLGIVSPVFHELWKLAPWMSVFYAAALLLILAWFPWQSLRRRVVASADLCLGLGLLVFIAGIMMIDQVVPMSTSRNFLVAMPAFLYLLARVGVQVLSPLWLLRMLVLWVALQLATMGLLMHYKQGEFENYRRATDMVIALMDQGYAGYYLDPCLGTQGYNSDAMNNLYMDLHDAKHRHLLLMCVGDLKAGVPALAILACHQPIGKNQLVLPQGYDTLRMDERGMCSVVKSRSGIIVEAR